MQRSVLGSSQQQMQSPTKLRDTEVDWLWKRVPMQTRSWIKSIQKRALAVQGSSDRAP